MIRSTILPRIGGGRLISRGGMIAAPLRGGMTGRAALAGIALWLAEPSPPLSIDGGSNGASIMFTDRAGPATIDIAEGRPVGQHLAARLRPRKTRIMRSTTHWKIRAAGRSARPRRTVSARAVHHQMNRARSGGETRHVQPGRPMARRGTMRQRQARQKPVREAHRKALRLGEGSGGIRPADSVHSGSQRHCRRTSCPLISSARMPSPGHFIAQPKRHRPPLCQGTIAIPPVDPAAARFRGGFPRACSDPPGHPWDQSLPKPDGAPLFSGGSMKQGFSKARDEGLDSASRGPLKEHKKNIISCRPAASCPSGFPGLGPRDCCAACGSRQMFPLLWSRIKGMDRFCLRFRLRQRPRDYGWGKA